MTHHSTETLAEDSEASSRSLLAIIRIARLHPNPGLRVEVAHALGRLGGLRLPGMENELQALTLDPDPVVQEVALRSADRLDSPSHG